MKKKKAKKKAKKKQKNKNKLTVTIEEVYKIVNFVQLKYKNAKFLIKNEDQFVVDNILKDSEIDFRKKVNKNSMCRYCLVGHKPEVKTNYIDKIEEFEDEVIQEGEFL